jgi:hypothetical protein
LPDDALNFLLEYYHGDLLDEDSSYGIPNQEFEYNHLKEDPDKWLGIVGSALSVDEISKHLKYMGMRLRRLIFDRVLMQIRVWSSSKGGRGPRIRALLKTSPRRRGWPHEER